MCIGDYKGCLGWQYVKDLNDIEKGVGDPDWEGFHNVLQIRSITYDASINCYVVFWIYEKAR